VESGVPNFGIRIKPRLIRRTEGGGGVQPSFMCLLTISLSRYTLWCMGILRLVAPTVLFNKIQ